MRHRVAGVKLNRTTAHRKALARGIIRGLFGSFDGKGYIITTRVKAKYAQPKAEKLITLARDKTVHNIRRAMAFLQDRETVARLFDEIGPFYSSRPGGYTRVVRMARHRLGDNAQRAYFGFVREEAAPEEPAEEKPVGTGSPNKKKKS